ncbi:Spo0B domain-containing protein [Peptococcaceae bacterium 1198_IL3148]
MKIPGLLEVIQVQRHDFLNHFQVISGLLQLKKPERAQDYINQVCAEMGTFSAISRLQVPELQAVLYIATNEANTHLIEFDFNINTKFADCSVPGNIIATAVEECINEAIKLLSPPEVEDRRLTLNVVELEKKIHCKFGLPGLSADIVADLESNLKYCRSLLAYGIQVSLVIKAEQAEIHLSLPRESL